jgi:hypothetical protein
MSQFSSDNDNDRVRIIINGEEVDPNNLPPNLIGKNKNGKSDKGGSSCLGSCFGLGITLIIVGSILCGVLAAASAIFNFNIPFMNEVMTALTGIQAPKTQSLKADPNNFDPFVGLTQAQAFAGADAKLVSMSISYIRSDGTMDLNASYSPAPRVDYKFVREVPRPADAPPVGVAGSTAGPWYEPITIEVYRPGTRRHVSISSGGTRVSFDYTNEGMVRDQDSPTSSSSFNIVKTPECTAKQLWDIALKNDAPIDAVASIEYDTDGYDFNIPGVVYLSFNNNCRLED